MQLCNRIYYFEVYWRLNMFRAAHRSSPGALHCSCSLWFIYPCGDRSWEMDPFPTQPWQRPVTTSVYKPEAAYTVQSSWWWAVCRSNHVESSINFGIINSITKLHLVGISTELSKMHGSMNIKFISSLVYLPQPICSNSFVAKLVTCSTDENTN